MRHTILLALVAVLGLVAPVPALASESVCTNAFPEVDWTTVDTRGPVTLATAGLNDATGERFAADVSRVAALVDAELGGLGGTSVCLATPELSDAFSDLVPRGQRLHVGVRAEQRILVISAVSLRFIDDSIAFGLPQIALWHVSKDLGHAQGYPEPLGSTIAHWYLARDTGRMEQLQNQMNLAIFFDDPNPEERTLDDATLWVGDWQQDPSLFDPQFLGSQMGVFVDFAVAEEGLSILSDTDQSTWAALENRWRISIRDEFPRGSFGLWWGLGIIVGFVVLAIGLAWMKRIQNKRAAQRRPTPPADESLFTSRSEA